MGTISETQKRLALEGDRGAQLSWLVDEIDEALECSSVGSMEFRAYEPWSPYKTRNSYLVDAGMEILDILGCAGKFGFSMNNVVSLIRGRRHGEMQSLALLIMIRDLFSVAVHKSSYDLLRPVNTEQFRVIYTAWNNKNVRKRRHPWTESDMSWKLTLFTRDRKSVV